MLTLHTVTGRRLAIVAMLSLGLLAVVPVAMAQEGGGGDDASPDTCAGCHQEIYEEWLTHGHSDSLNNPAFIQAYAQAGYAPYCQSCHATGYDAVTGTSSYPGVSCQSCHQPLAETPGSGHMAVNDSPELCSECHTGPHAADYDSWLMSDHATLNIGCGDCHQDHSADLHMEDATALCANCHSDELDATIHGEAGMSCVDCHMNPGGDTLDPLSGNPVSGLHSFGIAPDTCAECHGMTHTLTADGDSATLAPADHASNQQIAELEAEATNKLNLGLTGGGIGGLVLGITIPWVLYRRNGNGKNGRNGK